MIATSSISGLETSARKCEPSSSVLPGAVLGLPRRDEPRFRGRKDDGPPLGTLGAEEAEGEREDELAALTCSETLGSSGTEMDWGDLPEGPPGKPWRELEAERVMWCELGSVCRWCRKAAEDVGTRLGVLEPEAIG